MKKKLKLNRFYQQDFDFKTAKFDNKYLLKLWSKLNQEDTEIPVQLNSPKRDGMEDQKRIDKVSILDRYFFKRSPISYEEVKVVKRGLSQMTLEELKILEVYLQSTKVHNEVIESLKMIGVFLRKIINFIVSFILALGVLKYEEVQKLFKEIFINRDFWFLFILFIVYSSVITYLYTGISFMFSTRYKSEQIESIFPVMLKEAIDDKKND